MGLEWVLAVWGIAQLLVLAGLGGYAHSRALAAKDAQHEAEGYRRDLDVLETEAEVLRAQNDVLRKAATDVDIDLEDVRSRVLAERKRMLRAAREGDGEPGASPATDANGSSEDRDLGAEDLGPDLG